MRGVYFSGNANNGANAGFAYANANNAPSNTNANIGSQLCLNIEMLCNQPYTTHHCRPCPKSARVRTMRSIATIAGKKQITLEYRLW